MKNINGSEEPLSEYKSDVIKEIDVEDLHYMQDNRQIQLATEGASRERKRATRQYIPRAIMREKCTTRLGWDSPQKPDTQQAYPALKYERKVHDEGGHDRPITLGRLGSPLAFPFRIAKSRQSSRSVHGGSWGPMFRYNLNAIDKERAMETCMTCREKEKNRLATEITSTGRNSIGYADVQKNLHGMNGGTRS